MNLWGAGLIPKHAWIELRKSQFYSGEEFSAGLQPDTTNPFAIIFGGAGSVSVPEAGKYTESPRKSCLPVLISPCNYDIDKFFEKLKRITNGAYAVYGAIGYNCRNWAYDQIKEAKKYAKRKEELP